MTNDELREKLIEEAVAVWRHRSDEQIQGSPTSHCAAIVDAQLPRIREYVEKERIDERERARNWVTQPDTSDHPRTVGDVRAAIEGLPDDRQMFINISGQPEDYAIDEVWASEQIPDDEPWPTDKRTVGLEIHLGLFPERPPAAEEEATP